MYRIALKMLVEDRAKYIGMVLSISFSTLIITQQAAIFFGLMMRTYSVVTDTPQPDIWVMDPSVQMVDDVKPLKDTDLFRVRGVEGVAWAVPFYKGQISAKLGNGQFQNCFVFGIDDASCIGGPHTMLAGDVTHLRAPDAVIVNEIGAQGKLARDLPDGSKRPLQVGDTLELNYRRANVVGICRVTRPFRSQPIIYTTYDRATSYAPFERRMLSFVLVKAKSGVSQQKLCRRIQEATGFAAYTQRQFEVKTVRYYLDNTGIPINFGLAVALGLLVGAAIAGQIFYNFTSDNLRYFALFTAMGAYPSRLSRMMLLQSTVVAILGWGIGTGAAAFLGYVTSGTELSFYLPWHLCAATGLVMLLVSCVSCLISSIRVYNIDLAEILR